MTEVLAATPPAEGPPAAPEAAGGGLAAGPAIVPEGEAAQPAEGDPGPAEGEPARPRGPALSPSRAADFMTCPLLYRFRVIDRLPEAPSPAAARGTLVHAVLERLFDEPASDRTPQAARGLLPAQWDRLLAEEPA